MVFSYRTWTEKRLAALRALISYGDGSFYVTTKFNKMFGTTFTRSAIVGAADRYRIPWPAINGRQRSRIREPKPKFTKPREAFDGGPPIQHTPTLPDLAILKLTSRTCRWPIGDPANPNFKFCLSRTYRTGIPYCGYHCKIAYTPVVVRSIFVPRPRYR